MANTILDTPCEINKFQPLPETRVQASNCLMAGPKYLVAPTSYDGSAIHRRVSYDRFPLDANSKKQSDPTVILTGSGQTRFL